MKFLLSLIGLIFISLTTFAENTSLSTRSPCYFIVNPAVYGNPVEGGLEDVQFSEDKDFENAEGCFNILKWMVLPEDESFIGEFGTFHYRNRNSKSNYSRDCKYEVVKMPADVVKENLKNALMNSTTIEDLIPQFNEYKSELDKSVVVTCEFLSI